MFQEGPIDGVILRQLRPFADARGWLIELAREDELPQEHHLAMVYLSMTLPGVARGPHEHRQQADLFAMVGPGDFKLYLWDNRRDSPTYRNRQTIVLGESNPQAAIVPPGVVHAYRNLGEAPAWAFNAPNRLYAGWGRGEPVDEIRHENMPDSPYRLD